MNTDFKRCDAIKLVPLPPMFFEMNLNLLFVILKLHIHIVRRAISGKPFFLSMGSFITAPSGTYYIESSRGFSGIF